MIPLLAVTVSISNWRATVHYTSCPQYQKVRQGRLPIPRKMKVLLCRTCRPTTEDLLESTPLVDWFAYSPAPLAGVKITEVDLTETVEHLHARRALGLGRTPARRV